MEENTKKFFKDLSSIFDDKGEGYGVALILHPNYTSTSLLSASLNAKQIAEALSDLLYSWCIRNAKRYADSGESIDDEIMHRNMRAIADAAYSMAVMRYSQEPSTHKDIDDRATQAAMAIRAQQAAQRKAQQAGTPQTAVPPSTQTAAGTTPKSTAATNVSDLGAAIHTFTAEKKGATK